MRGCLGQYETVEAQGYSNQPGYAIRRTRCRFTVWGAARDALQSYPADRKCDMARLGAVFGLIIFAEQRTGTLRMAQRSAAL